MAVALLGVASLCDPPQSPAGGGPRIHRDQPLSSPTQAQTCPVAPREQGGRNMPQKAQGEPTRKPSLLRPWNGFVPTRTSSLSDVVCFV